MKTSDKAQPDNTQPGQPGQAAGEHGNQGHTLEDLAALTGLLNPGMAWQEAEALGEEEPPHPTDTPE